MDLPPIAFAVMDGDLDLAQARLQAGADIDAATRHGTALEVALRRGDQAAFLWCLEAGAVWDESRLRAIAAARPGSAELLCRCLSDHFARSGFPCLVVDPHRFEAACDGSVLDHWMEATEFEDLIATLGPSTLLAAGWVERFAAGLTPAAADLLLNPAYGHARAMIGAIDRHRPDPRVVALHRRIQAVLDRVPPADQVEALGQYRTWVATLERHGGPLEPDLEQALRAAVKACDADAVRRLLAQGADPFADHPQGADLLGLAARDEGVEVMRELIAAGASARARGAYSPWLRMPSHTRRWEVFRLLLEAGADVDESDAHHQRRLFDAVFHCRDRELVGRLLDAGASVNPIHPDERPVTYNALPHPDLLRLLIDRGLDVDASDGTPPVAIAVMYHHHEGLALLLAAGARADVVDRSGMRPIDYAYTWAGSGLVADALAERLLLDHGAAAFSACDRTHLAALDSEARRRHFGNAAQRGFLERCRCLLESGVGPDDAWYEGAPTALAMAAAIGHLELVDLLLAAGARVEREDKQGRTALVRAMEEGHATVVERLLDAGASPWHRRLPEREDQRTRIDRAVQRQVMERMSPQAEHEQRVAALRRTTADPARCWRAIEHARERVPAPGADADAAADAELDTRGYAAKYGCLMDPSAEVFIHGIAPAAVREWIESLVDAVVAERQHGSFTDLVVRLRDHHHLIHLQGDHTLTYLGQEEVLPLWTDSEAVADAARQRFDAEVTAM